MRYFLQGLTMGLAYVAPIGLQNMFVINTALTNSRSRAMLTALIVTFFDVTLALACFFGAGAVLQRYRWLQLVILFVGSAIVIYIGVGLLKQKESTLTQSEGSLSIRKTISRACVVTWFNPQAILDGTMMLGAFYVTLPSAQSAYFISGVACASCLWFSCITFIISLFSKKFNFKILRIINFVCGGVILFYGIKLLVNFIQAVI